MGGRSIAIQMPSAHRRLVGSQSTINSAAGAGGMPSDIRGSEITGRVTSACAPPALGRTIGLALMSRPMQSAHVKTFDIRVDGRQLIQARVVRFPF